MARKNNPGKKTTQTSDAQQDIQKQPLSAESGGMPNQEEHRFEKKFYPNIPYNRSRRTKFWVLMTLLSLSMMVVIGMFIAINQIPFAIAFLVFLILPLTLIPSTIKSYPVKENKPVLTVSGREIVAQDKNLLPLDIDRVEVTVLLPAVSKLRSENEAFIKEQASRFPEEECFGNVDIVLKPGPKVKKGEVLFLTVDDCLGALTALVGAGVKHYSIAFSLKKLREEAKFSITKEETKKQSLSDISAKDRMKQLL